MFIKLTALAIIDGDDVTKTPQGEIVFINAEHITRFHRGEKATEVYLSNGVALGVKEDRDDIANALSFLIV